MRAVSKGCLGILVLWPAFAQAAMVNVSSAFRPGPYTALHVDPTRPDYAVIGTADGYVLETSDGGLSTRESRAATPRLYSVQPLRGIYTEDTRIREQRRVRATQSTRADDSRYFLWQVDQGLPTARWQAWMAAEDRTAEITSLALPPGMNGRMLAAGNMGVLVSDEHHGAFSRAIGEPRSHGPDISGLSIVIDPRDRNEVLAGTSAGLRVSHNGGLSFGPHGDSEMNATQVKQLLWPPSEPTRVLALTADGVYESRDRGKHFSIIQKTEEEATAFAAEADRIWLATEDGLLVKDTTKSDAEEEPATRLPEQEIVAVVPLGEGRALAATVHTLYELDAEGETILMRTTAADPIVALGGTGETAWVLTRYGVFHTGRRPTRLADKVSDAPRMQLKLAAVQDAVVKRLGIGRPEDTRMADRWYAKLIPQITVRLKGLVTHDYSVTYDATFPISYRYATTAYSTACCGGGPDDSTALVIMVHWDLAQIFAGIGNAASPYSWIEQGLRPIKGRILEEVRWRYRESERLAVQLARPAADPLENLNWQLRLEENAAYLQAMSGREVITLKRMEEP